MKLIIDSNLCEPPSEIYPFRDVTLYAKTYIFDDILLKCRAGTRSLYWEWLKKYGAHDFISYLIKDSEIESGFLIAPGKANINVHKISYDNLNFIISSLKCLKK
jgi:hypothetical protein